MVGSSFMQGFCNQKSCEWPYAVGIVQGFPNEGARRGLDTSLIRPSSASTAAKPALQVALWHKIHYP
jgi:hypothetical protein